MALKSRTPTFSPILVEGQLVSNLKLGQSARATGRIAGLASPDRAMLVDELRFTVNDQDTALPNVSPLPAMTQVRISAGRQELTRGLMLLDTLCAPLDHVVNVPGNSATSVSSYARTQFSYIWRFRPAMYLPDNVSLDVAFALSDQGSFGGFVPATNQFRATMVGRTLSRDEPPPKVIHVPHASVWYPPAIASDALVHRATSTPADLANDHRETLHIRRLTATAKYDDQASPLRVLDAFAAFGQGFQIRVFEEGGEQGVKDLTPVGALFNLGRRSWTVTADLKPGGYLIADLEYQALETLGVGGAPIEFFGLAMVGYRSIPLAELGAAA